MRNDVWYRLNWQSRDLEEEIAEQAWAKAHGLPARKKAAAERLTQLYSAYAATRKAIDILENL